MPRQSSRPSAQQTRGRPSPVRAMAWSTFPHSTSLPLLCLTDPAPPPATHRDRPSAAHDAVGDAKRTFAAAERARVSKVRALSRFWRLARQEWLKIGPPRDRRSWNGFGEGLWAGRVCSAVMLRCVVGCSLRVMQQPWGPRGTRAWAGVEGGQKGNCGQGPDGVSVPQAEGTHGPQRTAKDMQPDTCHAAHTGTCQAAGTLPQHLGRWRWVLFSGQPQCSDAEPRETLPRHIRLVALVCGARMLHVSAAYMAGGQGH